MTDDAMEPRRYWIDLTRQNWMGWAVFCGALLVALVGFNRFSAAGVTLAYSDAISHLEISRRVIDGGPNHLGQLGGVWLPLPHLLALPLVWIDGLYYSGYAGSVVSMVAYALTVLIVFRIVWRLTGQWAPGVAAATVLALNPDVIYMQSTPMTELPLFACIAAAAFLVQRWAETDRYTYLIGGALAALLGTLTRYEAWVFLAALTLAVLYICWRNGYGRHKIEDHMILFLLCGAAGIVGWVVWNLAIFGDPLNFQYGEYAKPSLWVGEHDPAVGDLRIAAATYWHAVVGTVGVPTLVLAAIGLVGLIVRERFSARSAPILALLVFWPFFVVALERGQRPLHVAQIGGNLYNVRFGLIMVLPAAILAGYAIALLGRRLARLAAAAVLVTTAGLAGHALGDHSQRIVTLREPLVAAKSDHAVSSTDVSTFLYTRYHGGKLLMEAFGNELVSFHSRVPVAWTVYEGSYRVWPRALRDPHASNIAWIVMRHPGGAPPDRVYDRLHGTTALQPYRRVFRNRQYAVYRHRADTP